jgi:hypothetical protein
MGPDDVFAEGKNSLGDLKENYALIPRARKRKEMKEELLIEAKRLFPGGRIDGKIIDWMCDECFRTHHPDTCDHYKNSMATYWIIKRKKLRGKKR